MVPDEFTEQQWQQLLAAGPAIARAVAAASGSERQSEAELATFLELLERTADDTEQSRLLGRLAADTRTMLADGALPMAGQDVVFEGLHAARQAGAMLAVVGDEEEARSVRMWLMEIGRVVAEAAREGGLMGIGGEQISRPEHETIQAIADALGLAEPT
jgi:hypothetical protein